MDNDDPVVAERASWQPNNHYTDLVDVSSAIDPLPALHTILKLQAGIVHVCNSCQASDPNLLYFTLPCGHTFQGECLKTRLRPEGVDHDGHALPRQCPSCLHSWGPQLPYAETADTIEDADWNNVTFATKVRNGLDHLCEARANVSRMLSGEERLRSSCLRFKEVLYIDTCVWPLLAMEVLLPQRHEFNESMAFHWRFISRNAYHLLRDELPVQGSPYELRMWLKRAIFARICAQLRNPWEGPVGTHTYSLASLQKYNIGDEGIDSVVLWSLLSSPDQTPGGHFGLLIDSLLEADSQCYFDSRIQFMDVGGVEKASCTICLEQEESVSLACGHCFGQECLTEWFSQGDERKCPTCRTEFPAFLAIPIFNLNHDNLCQIVWMNEELERQALRDIHDITKHGLNILHFRDHSIWQMLESDTRYTVSIDRCLFPLITMSQYLERLVETGGINGRCWHMVIAAICFLLRTTFFGKQGTAAELCEELQIGACHLLQDVYDAKIQIAHVRESSVALLRVADDPEEWACYAPEGVWPSLYEFLLLYVISKCPKHESRGRFESDGE